MPSLNTCSIAGRPVLDPPSPDMVNWFHATTGAGRYGHGLFLLTADDYDAAVTAAGTGTAKLVMRDHRGETGGLSIDVFIASAMPYAGTVGSGNTLAGVVAVQVYDARYAKDTAVTKQANVQRSGFEHDASNDPKFSASSLSGGTTEWTWATLIPTLEGVPTLPENPTWKPRNISISGWQLHRAVDWIAAELFVVAGWDYGEGAFKFHAPGVATAANTTLFNDALANLFVNGSAGKRNAQRLPRSFAVTFSGVNIADVGSSTADYVKTVTTAGGGTIQPLHVGAYVAANNAGTALHTADLDTVATDLAARAFAFISVAPAAYEFAGIVPFNPDGFFRDVLWISNGQGARTRVLSGVRFDWAASANGGLWGYADPAMPGAVPRLEFPSDQLTVGLGGAHTSVGPSGTRYVWAGLAKGVFPVSCTKTSGGAGAGSDPGPSSNCSYVYTVTDLAGTTLGTSMSPLRYRIPGVAYTVGDGYGDAFYDASGGLQLIEAFGEHPDGEECPDPGGTP